MKTKTLGLLLALLLYASIITAQGLITTSAYDIPWLQIISLDPGDKSIRPEKTVIYTSVHPIVQQVGDQWQITFIKP